MIPDIVLIHFHDKVTVSFLPPRNCVGMRLSILETKLTLAAVLQKFTPVPCDKTVFPIVLEENALAAKDGLFLQFNSRKAHLKTT